LKDRRYTAIKSLIETNKIAKFSDIFTILPISVIKEDMQVNYNTLRRKIFNPMLLTLKDITKMAELFKVKTYLLLELIESEIKDMSTKKDS
jgi:hypothetical protein